MLVAINCSFLVSYECSILGGWVYNKSIDIFFNQNCWKLAVSNTYRVADPSCHPQISLCARIQKKTRVLNWPPSEMTKSRICHPKQMAESPTLVTLGVASSGLCHFRGWPVQDSVFFWILAHREIWGWQEGSATLYLRLFGHPYWQFLNFETYYLGLF